MLFSGRGILVGRCLANSVRFLLSKVFQSQNVFAQTSVTQNLELKSWVYKNCHLAFHMLIFQILNFHLEKSPKPYDWKSEKSFQRFCNWKTQQCSYYFQCGQLHVLYFWFISTKVKEAMYGKPARTWPLAGSASCLLLPYLSLQGKHAFRCKYTDFSLNDMLSFW